MDDAQLEKVYPAISGQPILTVTDSDNAFRRGGMINFVFDDGKLRFDIAPKSAGPAGLRISARLLTTARKVLTSPS
jgi:hypothetical protein